MQSWKAQGEEKMKITIEDLNLPLKKVLERMVILREREYDSWIEGLGNGKVRVIFERKNYIGVGG